MKTSCQLTQVLKVTTLGLGMTLLTPSLLRANTEVDELGMDAAEMEVSDSLSIEEQAAVDGDAVSDNEAQDNLDRRRAFYECTARPISYRGALPVIAVARSQERAFFRASRQCERRHNTRCIVRCRVRFH